MRRWQRCPNDFRTATFLKLPRASKRELMPDQWFRPQLVLEVKGAELTLSPNHRAAQDAVRPGSGLALRFPRFTGRIRDDKGPTEATTSTELLEMYRGQVPTGNPLGRRGARGRQELTRPRRLVRPKA